MVKGPREDAGGASGIHPGRELVKKFYGYCKRHHPKTKIMVSGIRTREDALSVAGVDYIVLGPKVLKLLDEVPTAEGYNYDLSGVDDKLAFGGVEDRISPSMGLEDEQELPLDKVTYDHFDDCLGYAGNDLLAKVMLTTSHPLRRVALFCAEYSAECRQHQPTPVRFVLYDSGYGVNKRAQYFISGPLRYGPCILYTIDLGCSKSRARGICHIIIVSTL